MHFVDKKMRATVHRKSFGKIEQTVFRKPQIIQTYVNGFVSIGGEIIANVL